MKNFVGLLTIGMACAPAMDPPAPISPPASVTTLPKQPAPAKAESKPAWSWQAETNAASHIGDGIHPPGEQAWSTAKVATLWGAEKLGCKGRLTKGWLRIDCPVAVNNPDEPAFINTGNGSWRARWDKSSFAVVLAVAHGLETKLLVGAGEAGVIVSLQWRLHASQPKVLGYINDTETPRCAGKLPGAGAAFESQIEDCGRAGYESCDELAMCLRGEPTNFPSCAKGWKFMGYCAYPCKTGADCAAGWACSKGADGSPVCASK